MKQFLLGSRKRKAVSVVALLLLVSSTALAAWVVYMATVDGGGSGSLGSTTTPTASVTLTVVSPPNNLTAGDTSAVLNIDATNHAPTPKHILTLTPTFTTNPSTCAQYLSLVDNNIVDATGTAVQETWLQPGQTRRLNTQVSGGSPAAPLSTAKLAVAAGAPSTCAGATWNLAFTGTTN